VTVQGLAWHGPSKDSRGTARTAPHRLDRAPPIQKERNAPQSGHSQVTWLQVKPQRSLCRHSSQMEKPQLQVQRKGCCR